MLTSCIIPAVGEASKIKFGTQFKFVEAIIKLYANENVGIAMG